MKDDDTSFRFGSVATASCGPSRTPCPVVPRRPVIKSQCYCMSVMIGGDSEVRAFTDSIVCDPKASRDQKPMLLHVGCYQRRQQGGGFPRTPWSVNPRHLVIRIGCYCTSAMFCSDSEVQGLEPSDAFPIDEFDSPLLFCTDSIVCSL